MFDDQPLKNQAGAIPPNLPVDGPADMFGDDNQAVASLSAVNEPASALDAGILRPVAPAVKTVASAPAMAKEETPRYIVPPSESTPAFALKEPTVARTLIMTILILAVLAALGAGGWWAYNYFLGAKPITLPPAEENVTPIIDETPIAETTVVEETVATDINTQIADEQILFGEPIDKDGDSLDDSRELELGTDPNNWDTDNDELSDGDEVLIWKTDPLKSDSDGDGYADGAEVKNGYNPAGPGKIFSPPVNG